MTQLLKSNEPPQIRTNYRRLDGEINKKSQTKLADVHPYVTREDFTAKSRLGIL